MAITLDADLEQRMQRQLDRGAFREPAELLAERRAEAVRE
jgi:hypothetical protein